MPSPDVALVVATQPHPADETAVLCTALIDRGVDTEVVAWDDPDVDWASHRLAVVRATWDYHDRFDEFLAWIDRVATATTLLNDRATLRWNTHKSYLFDLEAASVPIVPTRLLHRGNTATVDDVRRITGWRRAVVKPAVSLGADRTFVVEEDEPGQLLVGLAVNGDVLVQPWLPGIEDGEVSLVYFEGSFSHAMRKHPAPGDWRVQERFGGTMGPHEPSPLELSLGQAAMDAVGKRLLYGRVDTVAHEGRPVVMELELVEPSLYLAHGPDALDNACRAIAGRLGN